MVGDFFHAFFFCCVMFVFEEVSVNGTFWILFFFRFVVLSGLKKWKRVDYKVRVVCFEVFVTLRLKTSQV